MLDLLSALAVLCIAVSMIIMWTIVSKEVKRSNLMAQNLNVIRAALMEFSVLREIPRDSTNSDGKDAS